MSERLSKALENIRSVSGVARLDEASIRQVVVLQILASLEWDQFNHAEVTPEFATSSGRVDFSLQIGGQSKVFIEVKRGGEALSPHQDQLLRYSFERGVSLAVLTNGLEWWFYLPLREGSWEDRRFSAINVTSEDRDEVETILLVLLSKDRVESGSAIEYGENLLERRREDKIVNESLPKAWNSLVTEPDKRLMVLLAERVEQISQVNPDSSLVRSFILNKIVRTPDISLVEPKVQEYRDSEHSPINAHPPEPASSTDTKDGVRLIGSASGKKPIAFYFLGTKYPVSSWKEVLQRLSEKMYTKYPTEFGEKVYELRGRSWPYYSRNRSDLNKPRSVGSSGWFVGARGRADSVLKQCYELLSRFGHDKSDLEIFVRR